MRKQIIYCLFFIFLLICVIKTQDILSPIITLHNGGQIQGTRLSSYKNNFYWAFQEVPYAAPPVGNLRFKEPVDPNVWAGILPTTKNTKICWQLRSTDSKETEDCLYLNIYTPSDLKNETASLPVYVYIHGGVFTDDDGTIESFGPELLMDYNIILVTMNYRLGAIGFLSTEDNIIPGNLGLIDQTFALKWVQKNIHRFGGDPKRVTIGGQSAGAGCVGYHLLSGRSTGLFRAAIQESGSPVCSKMFLKQPRYFAFQLGHFLDNNINNNSSSVELLEVLLKATAANIKKWSNLPIPENMRNLVGNEGNTVWNPVEEYQANGFIVGPMHENFKSGKFNRVPTLIGFNSEEEVHFDLNLLKTKTKYFDSNSTYLINGNLNIKKDNILKAGTALKKVYTNKTFDEDFEAFVKFISDAKYTIGICRQAELQSKFTDVFLYQFSYQGILGGTNSTIPGVGHTDELNYLFINDFNRNIKSFPVPDLNKSHQLLTLWTNFIKYLNPMPSICLHKWPRVTKDRLIYMNINSRLKLEKNPRYFKNVKEIYETYAEDLQYTF